jgi:hypothetical protein
VRGWYCVYVEHLRLTLAVDVTFRNMLISEYLEIDSPENCWVYRKVHGDCSYSYFFSPEATEALEAFIRFWGGFGCSEPTGLHQMEVVLPQSSTETIRNEEFEPA